MQPRIRVHLGQGRFVGPGKVELLEHIDRTGSISEAARVMGMSYMRAWTLLKSLDGCFAEPPILKSRGGHARGGARLSRTGRLIVTLYREMESATLAAAAGARQGFGRLLKT